MPDYLVHRLGEVELQSGATLPDARLAYKTYGKLNAAGDNAVLLPTFYTGTHRRNEGFFGAGRALDPRRHFIISVNLFGNGVSSSPSNSPPPTAGADFPRITLRDNIRCQHRLLTERLGVERIALVAGWSMAGCQAFHWASQYPGMVEAILPFCASARTSKHNWVFLEGVKAALQADGAFNNGGYAEPPVAGLKAFARVYAGWAYSQTFYRDGLYRQLGFESVEALLSGWEQDHLHWDANDLLAKLWSWQNADISDNERYHGDLAAALKAIRARTIIIACSDDLYFPPQDNVPEAQNIPGGELRIYRSPWGHCVASPGVDARFAEFLDRAIESLLDR
ncbi:MAG: alpha/beta fold hydrolase [Gammaproteobacteria bacterium]|nr:alpha/beta fold hydrolase [Gammaproteobacteria bacterium]